METRSSRAYYKIMMIPHVAVGIFGLIWVTIPGVFLRNFSPVYMDQKWADFVQESAKLSFFISSLGRFYGIMMVSLGFYAVATTLTAYKRSEKWSWYAFLAINTIGYGCALIADSIAGLRVLVIIEAILLLTAYTGLSVSAKAILKKTSHILDRMSSRG
jgi:sensor histidine kinase YesM